MAAKAKANAIQRTDQAMASRNLSSRRAPADDEQVEPQHRKNEEVEENPKKDHRKSYDMFVSEAPQGVAKGVIWIRIWYLRLP